MVTVNVDSGELEALIKRIAEQGDEAKEWVADEITYAAFEIESKAKARCPVVTGRLRASIRSFVDRDTLSAIVGTNVEYAPLVEYGRITKTGRKIRGTAFLYPAYFEVAGKLLERIKRNLNGK